MMPTDTSDGCKRVLFDNMQQNLYEKITDMNILYQSFQKCKMGVDWKASIQRYEANLLPNLIKLRRSLIEGTYTPDRFVEFDVNERGKKDISNHHQSETEYFKEQSAIMF